MPLYLLVDTWLPGSRDPNGHLMSQKLETSLLRWLETEAFGFGRFRLDNSTPV